MHSPKVLQKALPHLSQLFIVLLKYAGDEFLSLIGSHEQKYCHNPWSKELIVVCLRRLAVQFFPPHFFFLFEFKSNIATDCCSGEFCSNLPTGR